MLDDFNSQKLPSFSNEPQQFANMTLFMRNDELVLHIHTHACGIIRKGELVEEVANYYLGYEERETKQFMAFAEMQLKHIERSSAHIGKPITISDEKRPETLRRIALEAAARWADNCDDNHDLSPEFCLAAEQLGQALQDRFKAGMKTMTIYESSSSGMSVANNRKLII